MTTNQTIDGVLREDLELVLIHGHSTTESNAAWDRLRGLGSAAPVCRACNDTGRMHEPGCDPGACTACLEKPAVQPQGEQVKLYAEQPAPVAEVKT